MNKKYYSAACERNAEPILHILRPLLTDGACVLEIGSGTGQHAVMFGAALPNVSWQTSDLPENHGSICAWREDAGADNVLPPLPLDMRAPVWPPRQFDLVFSANTLHIMGWPEVQRLFAGVGQVLKRGGRLCVYGPFNYAGRFTSDSNAMFDASLRAMSPVQGIRDSEAVMELASANGMALETDHSMPSNNRMLVWTKSG